jgi:uroporphyrinogen-III synthase
MRVIVTRPASQALPWVAALREQGVDAVALPLIGIEPAADPGALRTAWAHLDGAALAMFVSPNAVTHFFEARPVGAAWPETTRAGSTGPGTTAALRAAGLPPDIIVEPPAEGPFDTESLWQQLAQQDWRGRRVVIVRGDGGRDWFAATLRGAGADVQFVTAYRRVAPAVDATLVQAAMADAAAHRWHFSSSEAIDHLVNDSPGADWSAAIAWATHPRIADSARRQGFGRVTLVGVRVDDVVAQWRREGGAGASIESAAQ